jgi:hypothetical protein
MMADDVSGCLKSLLLVCLVKGGHPVRVCPRSVMVGQIPMSLGVRDDHFTCDRVARVSGMQLYLLNG